jgi:hypothetical protein
MGQLTNLYVSQSYQGLLKMTDSTNGLTNTLQTVQTGDGDNSPLQMSFTEVNISGSLTVNGQPIAANTGSLVTTASFNAYTSSVNTELAGLNIETGSLQNQINGLATTGSLSGFTTTTTFNNYTSSNDSKVNSLIANTGSYATTSSLTALSQSIASTDLSQDNRLTALEGVTGSINRNGLITTGSIGGTQSITGSLNVQGTLTATSASITYLETVYETASIIYSSGSNQFGDASNDTQTLWGTVNLPSGPFSVTGNTLLNGNVDITTGNLNVYSSISRFSGSQVIVTGSLNVTEGITGSLQGTASYATNALSASNSVNSDSSISSSFAQTAISSSQAQNAVSASQAQNAVSASYAPDNSNRNGLITTGSIGGTQFITGAVVIDGRLNIASGSYLETDGITNAGPGENIEIAPRSGANVIVNVQNSTDKFIVKSVLGGAIVDITGSLNVTQGITGSLFGTSSYATNALSSSFSQFAISSSQAQNAVTASFLTGTVASASFATNAATASIAFDLVVNGKCDNPGGLLKGTIVRITGNSGDNALFNSASWEDDNNSANTLGMLTADVAYNAFANIVTQGKVIGINTDNMTAGDLLFLSSSGQYTTSSVPAPYHEVRLGQVLRPQLNNGSAYISIDNGYELTELHDVDITSPVSGDLLVYRSGSYGQWVNETGAELGFATTGSNIFKGDQTITGSLNVRSGSLSTISNNTTVDINLYLTSSQAGQVNIIKGWSENPNSGGPGAVQANYTGSLRITGSNNIVSMPQIRATGVGGGTDQQGYISGSDNTIASNGSGIFLNTGSLLFPKTSGNYVGVSGNIFMNFTTSSLSGGHPILTNNILYGGSATINSNSGSITSLSNNIIVGGSITSTQNFVTNTRPSISNNNIIGIVALNHISSSINYQNNYNNSPVTVNNHLSSSITNNSLTINNNAIFGGSSSTGLSIWASGSQSSNATRNIIDNLIGGKNIIVSSSFVSSSNSNLVSSLIYGQNLIVSGNHAATIGGSTFLGRYNDATSLHLAQDIVFAVGTGTGTSTRRTGLYVTSGSLVGVSGSLQVIGNTTMSGSLDVIGNTNFTGSVNITSSLTNALNVSGTMNVQRIQLDTSPFVAGTLSNLGAMRFNDNNTFNISNYDKTLFPSGAYIDLTSNTGSNFAEINLYAKYGGVDNDGVKISNYNGSTVTTITTDNTIVVGNTTMTGSLNVTAGITGSLEGTASYASQALTASFALNAVSTDTGSLMKTGSVASNVLTFTKGDGSTFNLTVATGSGGGSSFPFTGSAIISGSLTVTGSILVSNGTNSGSVITNQTDDQSLPRVNNIVTLTSAEYNTMATASTLDANTLYVVSGSAAVSPFPYSGSIVVTGSIQGNVNALSISSNTASLDLNNGNFFTLQLVSGSATHINPSNIKPGQTINILLSTTGSGTVNFPSSVKQVSGSSYVPTTTTSKDIITLVSFDSSSLFLANVKNLI